MMSDFIEKNISGEKTGPMLHSMMFYNDIIVQKYQKNALSVLQDNLNWMTDNQTMGEDEEICVSSIFAFMELCMAELMYQGVKEIKLKKLMRSAEASSTLKKKKYSKLSNELKKKAVSWSLWNYEDEVLAMSASVKKIVGGCLGFLADRSFEGNVKKADIDAMFDEVKTLLEDQSLPNAIGNEEDEMFDTEEEKVITLDLISKAMFSEDYIETVIDFCFDS